MGLLRNDKFIENNHMKNNIQKEKFIEKLKTLPNKPGVYFFKDNTNKIIYIGKAKSLKKRVSSYFKSEIFDYKTIALLNSIKFIDYMITESEKEAFLWEDKLIKKFMPKYNINLKDSKTYPYLKIVNCKYPYLSITRKFVEDGSAYYGPYVDVKSLRNILRFIGRLFPIRKCRKDLTKNNKHRPCLNYQMGYCLGSCVEKVNEKTYLNMIKDLKCFLGGKYKYLVKQWMREIKQLIKDLKFEEANILKKKLETLNSIENFDINLWRIDEKKVVEMMDSIENKDDSLEKILNLKEPIKIIAGFDISNISGKYAVGSQVVFIDDKPAKDRYRKYKIKYTKNEPNDVAMIREIVSRCLKNPLNKDIDLFLIDGGIGQVNGAYSELQKNNINTKILGIAKKEELLYLPNTKEPIRLNRNSASLKLLMQIRDEAHRFAVKYHRQLREQL
jgi:excinuclease ABC subunit C